MLAWCHLQGETQVQTHLEPNSQQHQQLVRLCGKPNPSARQVHQHTLQKLSCRSLRLVHGHVHLGSVCQGNPHQAGSTRDETPFNGWTQKRKRQWLLPENLGYAGKSTTQASTSYSICSAQVRKAAGIASQPASEEGLERSTRFHERVFGLSRSNPSGCL